MTKLYIDHLRNPKSDDYTILRSYSEAVSWMRRNGCPEYISFDHDLGTPDKLSGYDIAKWMVKMDLNSSGQFIPDNFNYCSHSSNIIGAENIKCLFNSYLRQKLKN